MIFRWTRHSVATSHMATSFRPVLAAWFLLPSSFRAVLAVRSLPSGPFVRPLPGGPFCPIPSVRPLPCGPCRPVLSVRPLPGGPFRAVLAVRPLPGGPFLAAPSVRPFPCGPFCLVPSGRSFRKPDGVPLDPMGAEGRVMPSGASEGPSAGASGKPFKPLRGILCGCFKGLFAGASRILCGGSRVLCGGRWVLSPGFSRAGLRRVTGRGGDGLRSGALRVGGEQDGEETEGSRLVQGFVAVAALGRLDA
ncbi:hypothetical protein Aros01_02488 [Streptosporangium roseum]|uniref:Uncharacterized protein n=1 Tax=Streptosporangium roseum (strain ATCC 12428 / DSM 43021 / JCM 3005 / KCTC 9067 / NCIMB 10171 / NRRL 2505 / NI 9100) TaxID=479432 RepID=D2B2P0_STRRD|nr:hypothetical protein Sros_0492 [Streptosporangium roseum DSM 43021]